MKLQDEHGGGMGEGSGGEENDEGESSGERPAAGRKHAFIVTQAGGIARRLGRQRQDLCRSPKTR